MHRNWRRHRKNDLTCERTAPWFAAPIINPCFALAFVHTTVIVLCTGACRYVVLITCFWCTKGGRTAKPPECGADYFDALLLLLLLLLLSLIRFVHSYTTVVVVVVVHSTALFSAQVASIRFVNSYTTVVVVVVVVTNSLHRRCHTPNWRTKKENEVPWEWERD